VALASRHASVVVSRLGWWLASGLAYVAVVAAARFYISALTSQHYEQRARDAYRAQKVLRKISFAASRVRKTNHQKGSLVTAANAARVRWQSVAAEVVAGRNASSETVSPQRRASGTAGVRPSRSSRAVTRAARPSRQRRASGRVRPSNRRRGTTCHLPWPSTCAAPRGPTGVWSRPRASIQPVTSPAASGTAIRRPGPIRVAARSA
jgi:hypothetical protein